MKLHLAGAEGANSIRGCSPEGIRVGSGGNQITCEGAVVVLPDALINPWAPQSLDALEAAHLEAIAEKAPELVLLGTGATQRFPHPSITRALTDRGIGVEIMDTQAACRTYNVILAEGRYVAAACMPITIARG